MDSYCYGFVGYMSSLNVAMWLCGSVRVHVCVGGRWRATDVGGGVWNL